MVTHNNKNIYLATLSAGLATSCGYRLIFGPLTEIDRISQIERGKEYFDKVQAGIDYRENLLKMNPIYINKEILEQLHALDEILFITKNINKAKKLLPKINKTLIALTSHDEINKQEFKNISNFFSDLSESVKYNISECPCRILN